MAAPVEGRRFSPLFALSAPRRGRSNALEVFARFDARAHLTCVRALLGGGATAALLPWIVGALGGDAATCLRLGGAFAAGTLVAELPAATIGDRIGRARPFFVVSGIAQALALFTIAVAHSLGAVAIGVGLLGVGAGVATGAEGRASLALGGDARTVAKLEVGALLGKGFVACVVAVVATIVARGRPPSSCARLAIGFSAAVALIAAVIAVGLRRSDRVHTVPNGRRDARRGPAGDRRRAWSTGVVALLVGVCALALAGRGTDALDAFAVLSRGTGVVLAASILALKGVVARLLAPHLARRRIVGVASAAAFAALVLTLATRLCAAPLLVAVGVGCGVAGGASAAARGLLLARVGARRVGFASAFESTLRRTALGLAAIALPSLATTPYFVAAVVAAVGGCAVLAPRVIFRLRRFRSVVRSRVQV